MSNRPEPRQQAVIEVVRLVGQMPAGESGGSSPAGNRPVVMAPIQLPKPGGDNAAAPSRPADPISHYIELEIEARGCTDIDALRFAISNSTRRIAQFDQAFLVEPTTVGGLTITRASSVSSVDSNAPLVRALGGWLQHPRHADILARQEPRQANVEQERQDWGLGGEAFAHPHALWLPIKGRDGRLLAALVALKNENWRPQQVALLLPLAGAYGHAWEALAPVRTLGVASARAYVSRRWLAIGAGLAAAGAAFIPVPLSALAPAEVVAREAVLVAAPIDGVIKDVLVPPGAWIDKGAPIIAFVDVKLRSDAEVAGRNVNVAEARYFRFVQSATATQKDMQEIATAKAELEVARAERAYARDLLDRSLVRADRAGLVIYAAKSDWIGKPVAVGERILEIGNPEATEIRIELPVSDAIVLDSSSRVALFLDGDPLRPIKGTVTRTSYRPMQSAEQQLVFRVNARFDDVARHRIGLRGIARVTGAPVSLWFYLLRRPIASVRQRLGL